MCWVHSALPWCKFLLLCLCLFALFFATAFPRNAPCPPASWVDSGSVHPWHCVWVSHAAVPGPDRVCCQREQHSCGPSGRGESGRSSQRDGVGSGETQKKACWCWLTRHTSIGHGGCKKEQDSVLDFAKKRAKSLGEILGFEVLTVFGRMGSSRRLPMVSSRPVLKTDTSRLMAPWVSGL